MVYASLKKYCSITVFKIVYYRDMAITTLIYALIDRVLFYFDEKVLLSNIDN